MNYFCHRITLWEEQLKAKLWRSAFNQVLNVLPRRNVAYKKLSVFFLACKYDYTISASVASIQDPGLGLDLDFFCLI